MKSSAKRNVPPVHKSRGEIDTRGEQIGQKRKAQIALEGPAQITADDIEVVPGPAFKNKAENEAFLNETLIILIHPTSERHPVDPVEVSVNGSSCFIWRNTPSIVKRKYVERLARAKPEGIAQDPSNPDPKIANTLHISSALLYPFSVIEDRNPLGHAWLQKILAEG